MRNILYDYMSDLQHRQRINIALSKGGATMNARRLDLSRPGSWEFSGFSQNGEDGIIDVLRGQLLAPNRYFIEVGAADGMQNNSSWLVVVEQCSGIMVEADAKLAARAARLLPGYSIGTEIRNQFITRENASELTSVAMHRDPDILSLDIDGNDYHVCCALLDSGLRPKIVVVEYNSVYGSERCLTITYQKEFDFQKAHPTQLYYGVSLAGWKKFFASRGYHFVTAERNGVNAFFADPTCFSPGFLSQVQPLDFADNRYQHTKFRLSSDEQFSLIADQAFLEI